jgi:hypothetical protein
VSPRTPVAPRRGSRRPLILQSSVRVPAPEGSPPLFVSPRTPVTPRRGSRRSKGHLSQRKRHRNATGV